jgi:type II secretory pathway pseudopilin PulG
MSTHTPVHERGISLIELLLGLAITALVLAPLVPMLQTASAVARFAGDRVALEREADFALERIATRIRATAPTKEVADKPSSEWLKPAVYSASNGMLIEQQGNETYVLAESVSAFGMTAAAVDSAHPLITVSLSLSLGPGKVSTTAVASVRMGTAR